MAFLIVAIYAAAPLAALGADNGRLVGPVELVPYYAALVLPALAIAALVAWRRGRRAANTAAACAAIAIVVAFDYWDLRPHLSALTHDSRPSMVFLWAVVLLVAIVVTVLLSRRVAQLPLVLLVAGVVWLVPSVVTWAHEYAQKPTDVSTGGAPEAQRLSYRPPPNVYFFMLDAYGRADRLYQEFGFDNTPFLQRLRRQGFVIPPDSQTAYPYTAASLPTMLQMHHVIDHGMLDTQSVDPIVRGHNTVVATFRSLGYRFAHAPSQLPNWTCDGSEDACIHASETYASHLGVSQLAWAVLERTPVADLMRSVAPVHLNPLTARRQFPLRVARAATNLTLRRPVFTFAHVLLTHWPYLYLGPKCRLAATRGKLGGKAYLQAVACTNQNTEGAIALILRRDPHAVIVLASDHGPDVSLPAGPQSQWPSRYVDWRFSNFVAMRLPRECRNDVPRRLFTPNIFRVVLNCLTDPDMPLVPNRRYFATNTLEVERDRSVKR